VQRLSLQLVHGLSAFHSKLSALSQSSKSAFFPKALQRNCGGRRFNANKKYHLDRRLYTNVDNSNNNNYHPSVGRHIILVKLKHSLIWRDLSRVSLPPKDSVGYTLLTIASRLTLSQANLLHILHSCSVLVLFFTALGKLDETYASSSIST
jgi:hypothetical protein